MRRLLYEPHQKVKAFWPSSLPRLLRFRRVGLSVACSLMWFSRVPFLWAPGRGLYAKQSSQQPNVPAGQVIFLPLCAVSSTVQSASLPLSFPPLPHPSCPKQHVGASLGATPHCCSAVSRLDFYRRGIGPSWPLNARRRRFGWQGDSFLRGHLGCLEEVIFLTHTVP